MDMPIADLDVDEALVRALLAEQQPDLADLTVTEFDNGWDNVIFRLGEALSVRVPRRQVAAQLIEHEQRWLPELAPRLPLPISSPVRIGAPGPTFPFHWSVLAWLPGNDAATTPPSNMHRAAAALTHFLNALHLPAPDGYPLNPYRGVHLAERADAVEQRMEQLAGDIDSITIGSVWHRLRQAGRWDGPPMWLHGDLHPSNILVHHGSLSAVIDWGDTTAGDPATDLAVLWMLLPFDARLGVRHGCNIDADTWHRAGAWALNLALAYLVASADNPQMRQIGEHTLANVLSDPTL